MEKRKKIEPLTDKEKDYIKNLVLEELTTNLKEIPENSGEMKDFFKEVLTLSRIYLKL